MTTLPDAAPQPSAPSRFMLRHGALGTWQAITRGEYTALAAEIREHAARGDLHKLDGLSIARVTKPANA